MAAVALSLADVLDDAAENVPQTDAAWDELLYLLEVVAEDERERKGAAAQASTDATDPDTHTLNMFLKVREVASREVLLEIIVGEVKRRAERLEELEEQEDVARPLTKEGPEGWEEELGEREEQETVPFESTEAVEATLERKEGRARAWLAKMEELIGQRNHDLHAELRKTELEAVRNVAPRTKAEEVARDRVVDILTTERDRVKQRRDEAKAEERILTDLRVLKNHVAHTQADIATWVGAVEKFREMQQQQFEQSKDLMKTMAHSQKWIDWHQTLRSLSDDETDTVTDALAQYLDHGFAGKVIKDNHAKACRIASREYTGHYGTQAAVRYVFWADASVNRAGAAGAAVAYKHNMASTGTPWVTKTMTCERGTTSTHAEVWAIIDALETAKRRISDNANSSTESVAGKVVVIYSDCTTALDLIKTWPLGPIVPIWPMIKNIAASTYAIEQFGYKIELCWVPSHKGLFGNELADLAANEAREEAWRAQRVIGPHP
ncbi:uncharacterized protein BDZ99DRAFT_573713 [Mytilinidion resinicola]|uniref:RNase H type-1 domain-containing protein n=1 Tax=Mytilinidion resinicola TaxID=574789 RepID=A0A6A6YDY9_9PEZI|nr:uncharacterized protein BDZ99DRAFT_573713 [Mytilinidion resinicola]KAF2807042.1 hypothetical protein BDZ99DRAFT_573713 [Mytilinidion resinicola]